VQCKGALHCSTPRPPELFANLDSCLSLVLIHLKFGDDGILVQ
jgi:hypothetical protein